MRSIIKTKWFGRVTALSTVLALVMQIVPTLALATPAPPVQSSPADGSSSINQQPTLTWQSVPGAVTYVADIADNINFYGATSSGYQSGLSFTPPALNLDSLYHWRVKANDGAVGPASPTWHIFMPQTIGGPADGASTSLTPTLSWNNYKTTGGTSFEVQVNQDPTFAAANAVDTTTTSTSYVVPSGTLSLGVTYHWRVNVSANFLLADGVTQWTGTSAWSPSKSFVTPPSAPGAPTLISPADTSTLDTWRPTLTWSSVPGASTYNVYVTRQDTNGTRQFLNLTSTSLVYDTFVPTDRNSYSYSWYVVAVNTTGTATSSTFSFTTPASSGPPAATTLVAPANNVSPPVSNLSPTFSWTTAPYTKYYKFEISTTSNISSGLLRSVNLNPPTTSFGPSDPSYDLQTVLAYNTTYFWKVSPSNSWGSTGSAIWTFSTPPPPGPTLSAPANGSTLTTQTPTLSWTAVTGALHYEVQVATSTAFAAPLFLDTSVDATTGSSYSLTAPVNYNATYYWRVNSTDASGTSFWSSSQSFIGPPPPIPAAPVLQAPGSASGGSIVGFRPAFSWAISPGATSYGFQLSTDPAFGTSVVSQTGLTSTSFALTSDLNPTTTYYWRANGTNTSGTGSWASGFSFSTPVPAPAAPTSLSPNANTSVNTLRPHFSWNGTSDATTYHLEIYSDAGLTTIVGSADVSATQYDLTFDLAAAATYQWRVRGGNATSGLGQWSSASSFSTPAVPPPGVPVLLTPADGTMLTTLFPTLDWQADSTSSSYEVQISPSNAFPSTGLTDATVAGTEYQRPSWAKLNIGTQYFWRVRGLAGSVVGSWSLTRSFFTPSVPSVPTLSSPADGSSVATAQPTLTLNAVPAAATYTFQLSTASWFPNPIVITSATTQAAPTAPLAFNTTYYWRASATNGAGTSAWSTPRTFLTTTAPPAPTAPSLLAPSNNAVVGGSRPTFQWSAPTGATSYRLEWTKSPTFAWTEAARDNLTSTQFTLDVDLTFNTQYYWHVRATGAGGNSPFSQIYGFMTPSGPPGLPTLQSPPDTSSATSTQPQLTWTAVPGAQTYEVQIGTDNTFATPLSDTTVTTASYTPATALAVNATYFWRVKAINGVGDSGFTTPFSFVVPPPPGAVTLVAPADGTTVTTLQPTLSWNAATGATSYEIQYSKSSTFAYGINYGTSTTTSYTITTNLPLDVDFYWQVRADNGGGSGPWSNTQRFHSPASPPPPTTAPDPPVLVSPADTTQVTSLNPTFTWNAANYANGYRLQVAIDSAFTNLADSEFTSATSLTITNTLGYSTTYFWRVQAVNSIGTTNSAVQTIVTPPAPPPPAPTLQNPADGSMTTTVQPVFQWNASPTATNYRVQVSTAKDFSTVFLNATSSTTSYTMPAWQTLNNGTQYYWRVQGVNPQGAGAWSSTAGFTTPVAPPPPTIPPPPTLTSPGAADGTTPVPASGSLQPTFTWNASTGATSYRIQVAKNPNFLSLTGNSTTTSPTYSFPSWQSLTTGTQYWWRVQATNSVGTSAWSTLYTFVATNQPVTVPTVPTLTAPANGATASGTRPVLSWAASSGATTYHVSVSTNSSFSPNVIDSDLATTSYTPTADLAPGTYYWEVDAGNSGGTSAFSAAWSFIVPTPSAPAAPSLTAPANGATVSGVRPSLSWAASSGATTYHLAVSTSNTFATTVLTSDQATTSYNPTSDLAPGTYYWEVNAGNTAGTSPYSSAWSFVVPPPSTFGAPTPSAPGAATGGTAPTIATLQPSFSWSSVSGATSYQFQLSKNADLSSPLVNANDSSNSHSLPSWQSLAKATQYYWRVQAINGTGNSAWSTVFTFMTPSVPTAPTLTAPADGAKLTSHMPTLTWSAQPGATSYEIQISTNSWFGTKVVDVTVTGATYTPTSNLAAGTFYWRVLATNAAGTGPWATVRSFSIAP